MCMVVPGSSSISMGRSPAIFISRDSNGFCASTKFTILHGFLAPKRAVLWSCPITVSPCVAAHALASISYLYGRTGAEGAVSRNDGVGPVGFGWRRPRLQRDRVGIATRPRSYCCDTAARSFISFQEQSVSRSTVFSKSSLQCTASIALHRQHKATLRVRCIQVYIV
jgi:hypothetical protein